MCYRRPCAAQCTLHIHVLQMSVCRVHHWYKLRTSTGYRRPCVLYTTDTMYERPCATHVRVQIQTTSVCYTCPCVVYTTDTSNPRPTTSVCQSVVWTTNISYTRPSVVFTTDTSYTRPRDFLIHFFNTFVICAFCMHPSQYVRVN